MLAGMVSHSPGTLPPALRTPALELLVAMWQLWHSFASRGEERLRAEHGLSLREFIALGYVQGGAAEPTVLSQALGLPRYEISRLLRGLETRGLLRRLPAPEDGRKVNLALSPEGQTVWQSALTTVSALLDPSLTRLDEQQFTQLLAALSTLQPPGETQ